MPIYLQQIDVNTFQIDGVHFFITYDPQELRDRQSSKDSFVVAKSQSSISNVISMTSKMEVRNVLELGIFKGGSTVLYSKLFNPRKLIAIESVADPVPALDEFVKGSGLDERIKLVYGVDQSDHSAMTGILSHEFPNRDIDLIVDDASHHYYETKVSFEVVFPYLRPGGLYVIEKWGWAHWPGGHWQENGGVWHDKPALTNLVIEILMLSASRPGLIDDVLINHETVFIRRGYLDLGETDTDILGSYLTRGKGFAPIL